MQHSVLSVISFFVVLPVTAAARDAPQASTVQPWTASPLPAATNYDPVVKYDLWAELLTDTKRISGGGRITWRNRSDRPVHELWWHLYLNAFRNDRSTFMLESGGKLRTDRFQGDSWGWIEVTELGLITPEGSDDILATRRFMQPDDNNKDDRTVMRTPLPRPVPPGASITLQVAFLAQLPKVFARTGHSGDFYMVGQWFPKLGVLEVRGERGATEPRWNCHQFHATSEFYADYGSYKVAMTVPADFEVGATGPQVELRRRADGKVTYVHAQDRIHDFAWTASPRFLRRERTFRPDQHVRRDELEEVSALLDLEPGVLKLPEMKVVLLLMPENRDFEERYFRAVFNAIKWFGLWYGPYPYPVLTVVDPPRTARGARGMEYPTLITAGVSWPGREGSTTPEVVTVHEFGHQYWYGLVGSNEFEEAWLDEGLTTYSTGRVLDRAYGPLFLQPRGAALAGLPRDFWPQVTQTQFHSLFLLLSPDVDAVKRFAWRYRDSMSYGVNSYGRPALVLSQLEKEIGEEATARALRAYHLAWRYRHPASADLFRTVEEVSGRDLDTYFERTLASVGAVDYAVTRLVSERSRTPAGVFTTPDAPPGSLEHLQVSRAEARDIDDADTKEFRYETRVRIERRGETPWPVTVEVVFDDGSRERRSWDGRYRWREFRFDRPVQVKHAQLHPDGELLLDVNAVNDSRMRERSWLPGAVWGEETLYLLQTLWQMAGDVL